MTYDPAIIEAAEHALDRNVEDISTQEIEEAALAVIAAVTPLIRAQVLEEAAQVADKIEYMPPSASFIQGKIAARNIATSIRALKEQP